MRIDIISVVPEMLDGFLNTSILARATTPTTSIVG